MEKSDLQFRPIQPSDYKGLGKIICATWNYEKLCEPKTAQALARLYLASCLTNQTYTCVAVKQDDPVGIIMGKSKAIHRTTLRDAVRQFGAICAMLMRKDGRRILKLFEGFDNINKSLLAESPQTFEGEVAFFAVRSDQRGTGVGKELFHRVQAYLKSQNISSFYLYTDTTCNYGFYEHQGMRRLCEKRCCIKAKQGVEMSFFLYGSSPAMQRQLS